MSRSFLAIAIVAALSATPALACNGSSKTDGTVAKAGKAQKKKDGLTEISVVELQKKMANTKTAPMVFDANGDKTRGKYGVIPGATLLTSYREYKAAEVLPQDKSKEVVFYCSSTKCSASDVAAKRAIDAGHNNVKVLRVGIKGWVKEGAKVDAFKVAKQS